MPNRYAVGLYDKERYMKRKRCDKCFGRGTLDRKVLTAPTADGPSYYFKTIDCEYCDGEFNPTALTRLSDWFKERFGS